MPHPSKRRVLAITTYGVNAGMAFSAPGGHLQVWEIPISFDDTNIMRDRVYDAIKGLKPTTVITSHSGDIVLKEGIRAVCHTLLIPVVYHSIERPRHLLVYAEDRLRKLRSGPNTPDPEIGEDEARALAHAMVHLEEITRDHTARELART